MTWAVRSRGWLWTRVLLAMMYATLGCDDAEVGDGFGRTDAGDSADAARPHADASIGGCDMTRTDDALGAGAVDFFFVDNGIFGSNGIHGANVATGESVPLQGDEVGAWSPDRQWLIQSGDSGDESTVITSARFDGERVCSFPFTSDNIKWSPDGSRFLSVEGCPRAPRDEPCTLRVAELESQNVTQVPASPLTYPDSVEGAAWSHDGTRVLYWTTRELRVVDPDGSHDTLVAQWMADGDFVESHAWSPRERLIAFATGGRLQVRDDDLGTIVLETSAEGGLGWSPDGRWLTVNGKGKVRLVPIDGGEIVDLGRIERGTWAPDGGSYVYVEPADPAGVFLFDSHARMSRRIMTVHDLRTLVWSPEGDRFAFSHFLADSEKGEIVVANATGEIVAKHAGMGMNLIGLRGVDAIVYVEMDALFLWTPGEEAMRITTTESSNGAPNESVTLLTTAPHVLHCTRGPRTRAGYEPMQLVSIREDGSNRRVWWETANATTVTMFWTGPGQGGSCP